MADAAAVPEERLIFDKTYQCYVCEKKFTAKTVRTGKAHLIDRDLDMRPRYDLIDAVKYGTIVCPQCGYAVMERYYKPMPKSQVAAIREGISAKFNRPEDVGPYTYETARSRLEIVLLNAIARNAKNSERAYICLHLAWVVRGALEEMEALGEVDPIKRQKLAEDEKNFIKNAAEGFIMARQTEPIPMCGMDENSVDYLVSALLFETERYDEAAKLVMNVITSRSVKKQLKDKADRLKDMIKEKKAQM